MSSITRTYQVGRDFARAGEASGQIKAILKELGFSPAVIRRARVRQSYTVDEASAGCGS